MKHVIALVALDDTIICTHLMDGIKFVNHREIRQAKGIDPLGAYSNI